MYPLLVILSDDSPGGVVTVRRGNVVAFVRFPNRIRRRDSDAINIDTASRSATGKAFVKDLADALQIRFGLSGVRPLVEPDISDGGP
jgi:hypothetical protein